MGWWSGNRDDVNRRSKARFSDAKDLVSQTEDLAGERRDLKRQYLTRGHQRMMATNLKGATFTYLRYLLETKAIGENDATNSE